jgi:tripartite-type tricarboxylate transporter receptor subunit TctC
MKTDRFKISSVAAVLFAVNFLSYAPALAQTPYYQGKTITIVHGRDPGGTGDLRVRAMLPSLQKHIPGSPTIVNEFMPGGGGRAGPPKKKTAQTPPPRTKKKQKNRKVKL